jgi:hypothetical protein
MFKCLIRNNLKVNKSVATISRVCMEIFERRVFYELVKMKNIYSSYKFKNPRSWMKDKSTHAFTVTPKFSKKHEPFRNLSIFKL